MVHLPVLTKDQLIELAIEILRATNDGDRLSPQDLKIVELAVNNRLDSEGIVLFQELYRNATKAEGYTAPYLFAIEHLTIDQQGSVLWRGVVVEHFDHAVWRQPGWRESMQSDAQSVAIRCRHLEARGIPPTVANVLSCKFE